MKKRIGFYSGSFDPITRGHEDVIGRGAALVDELVIGVGVHDAKTPMLSADERVALIETVAGPLVAAHGTELTIVTFNDLAVDAAGRAGASVILRGLRDGTDLDYEAQMAAMNRAMAPDIETVFMSGSPEVRHIAANLVRQIAKMGGDVSAFVSSPVAQKLSEIHAPR